MAIPKGHRMNFDTLQRVFRDGNAALMECTEKSTGEKVYVICAAVREKNGDTTFKPYARLFKDNPYKEWEPPEGGKDGKK